MKFKTYKAGKENDGSYKGSDIPIPIKLNSLDDWIKVPMPTNVSKIINGTEVGMGYNRINKGLFKVFKGSLGGPCLEELTILQFFYFLKHTSIVHTNLDSIKRASKKIVNEHIKYHIRYKEELINAIDEIQWQ